MGDITKQVALRLPIGLLTDVDERAEAVGISRNQWFERMARFCLENTYNTHLDIGQRIARAETMDV